jgi:hypothetical protein
MAKVVCVLYDDPVDGYPTSYARDGIPRVRAYHNGQSTPSPEGIDFQPGEVASTDPLQPGELERHATHVRQTVARRL